MDYEPSREYLLDIFKQNNFVENYQNNNLHASQIIIDNCSNGTRIGVSFPGYKSKTTPRYVVYDYRVDILKEEKITALSHANIIVDIFNKMTMGGMSSLEFRKILIELAYEAHYDVQDITKRLTYNSAKPSDQLLERAKKAHKGKYYNRVGNSFDLTIEELIVSMKWIVLQEDINYPISKGYEGRKMPFSRYVETTHIIENTVYTLEDVIGRALTHSRPQNWDSIDYSFQDLMT